MMPAYGSDLIVDMLRLLEVEYVALVPGATFRGLHDSLVNYGNGGPEIILCNHEEISVAIAHGYARAAGRPMAAAVHNIVGLQHASMAIFNAWYDREPVLVLGGTGPMDSTRRRPWIDWVHTALVQGTLVRDFVKWDDQPGSVAAIPEAMLRAYRLATTEPKAPVYVCFDVDLQEQVLAAPVPIPASAATYRAPHPAHADPRDIDRAAELLADARAPVIVADFMGRNPAAVPDLAALAETLAAPVIDRGGRFNIANTHPLDLTGAGEDLLSDADVVLALDVPDLPAALGTVDRVTRAVRLETSDAVRLIQVGLSELTVRGWSSDYYLPLPAAVSMLASPVAVLPALRTAVSDRIRPKDSERDDRRVRLAKRHAALRAAWLAEARRSARAPMSAARLALEVWEAIQGADWVLAHGTAREWARRLWTWDRPDRYCGRTEPAGGLGFGLGASIGAALAYRGSGRLVVDLQPDGDFLFTPSALWTAAHHRLPLLVVTVNNRSYANDEEHQGLIAAARGRPVHNKGVGTRIDDPPPDLARVAQGMGVWAAGPIDDPAALGPALRQAVDVVRDGRPALVDVVTE